jgi:hypothetical protein
MGPIIVAAIGVLLIACGVLTLKGSTFLLKKRYLRNISPENIPAFCVMSGISLIAEGISLIITGAVLFVFGEESFLLIPMLILLIASSIPAVIATIKYSNHR